VTSSIILALAVFGACTVEAVEALTLVVAAGSTRGWRSALEGAGTALLLLAVVTGAVGVPLVRYVPINGLRVVIGALLLILGLQWLRKSILRSSGHKAMHDEDVIFQSTVAKLSGTATETKVKRDAVAFVVAFKGVLLEGTEVVLIVLSLGVSGHHLGLAVIAASAAVVLVTIVGFMVTRQLSEVPENTMKIVVGVMLSSFGVFWVGEGAGIHWPGSDLAILVLIAFFWAMTMASIASMKRFPIPAPSAAQPEVAH